MAGVHVAVVTLSLSRVVASRVAGTCALLTPKAIEVPAHGGPGSGADGNQKGGEKEDRTFGT